MRRIRAMVGSFAASYLWHDEAKVQSGQGVQVGSLVRVCVLAVRFVFAGHFYHSRHQFVVL